MKKSTLFFVAAMATSAVVFSQTSAQNATNKQETATTSLKPSDASPAVFSSQAELNAVIEQKKEGLRVLIRQNANDPEKVKQFREQLWRFEHAIIVEPSQNNK